MKRFLLFLILSQSINGSDLIPSSKTISNLTTQFSNISSVQGAVDASSSTFISSRINDLTHYKNYFVSYAKSRNKAFWVIGLFTIPIALKLYMDSKSKIDKSIQDRDSRKKELEDSLQKYLPEEKISKEDQEKQNLNDLKSKYAHLPSNSYLILSSISQTVWESLVAILTDPFSVQSSLKIICIASCVAYYYNSCKNHSHDKFRSVESVITLLFNKFNDKIKLLKNPPLSLNGTIDSSSMIQQVNNYDIIIKQIMEQFKSDNSLKKKVKTFLGLFFK